MFWLATFGLFLYVLPVIPVWCFIWGGSRPRRGRFASWAVASFIALFWLPWIALVWAGVQKTTTREQRIGARRRYNQNRQVDQLERELRSSSR